MCRALQTEREKQTHRLLDRRIRYRGRTPQRSLRPAGSTLLSALPVADDTPHLPPATTCNQETRREDSPARESPIPVPCRAAKHQRIPEVVGSRQPPSERELLAASSR